MCKEKIKNLLFSTNENIDQNILSCFNQMFKIKDSMYYYSNKLEKLVEIGKNPSISNAKLTYYVGLDYPDIVITTNKTKKLSNKNLILVAEVENKIDKVINKIDLFAPTSTIIKQNNVLEIINNKIFLKDIKLNEDISNDIYTNIVKDYYDHFKELKEVLDFIVACRFSENRRASFLHLRINAGWGKTFFLTMLKEIGLLLEVNYNDFKDPCGLLPSDFTNKIAIGIDEFTHFKSEFKKMSNELQLTPKFGFKSEVEVFAKLFFSAEASKSFTTGVTKQILDRVNLLDKNKYKIRLEDRSVYKRYGVFYREVLIHYINEYFKKEFDSYIGLGKLDADKKAYTYLNNFHNKYKIKSMEIETYFKQVIYNKINDYLDSRYVDNNFDLCKKSLIVKSDSVYIINPSKFFKEITLEEDEHLQRSAKFISINSVLDKETKRVRLDKVLRSFIEIKISDIKDYIEKDEADEEFRLFEESVDTDEITF